MRKVTLLKRLQLFKTSMTTLIEKLVSDSEAKLETTYVPALSGMQQQIQDTDELLSRLSVGLEDLTTEKNQIQVYKKAMKCKRALGETHVKPCKVESGVPECDGTLNRIIQTVVNSAKNDSYQGVANIAELDKDASVSSICKLQDGSVCLAVYNKRKIIRIDSNLENVDTFATESNVWGLCATVENEIAFTVPSVKKVNFVRFEERPNLKSSFSTSIHCRGIAFRGEMLYVSNGGFLGEECGQINVLDVKGQILQTFKVDSDGKLLFKTPRSVLVSAECIYVTDNQNGVICLDMHGKRQWVCKEPRFPWGLCFTQNENLLVAGRDSNNVIVFNRNGENIGELLNETDGLVSPEALSFDEQKRRLLVTTSDGSLLKMFDFEDFEI